MRFIDLFAGLGGFRMALERLGHECAFVSEIDEHLQEVYHRNFPGGPAVQGDIRLAKERVPPHDVLCAGFPCQPFSKSGTQAGMSDQTVGTLFHDILEILKVHRPCFVILENVGNFERHDGGRTWRVVRGSLERLGYKVKGTEHIASGGDGLLSPHHLGWPHHRERFFVAASLNGLPKNPFPPRDRNASTSISGIIQSGKDLSEQDRSETSISEQHQRCIEHWNLLLQSLPEKDVALPSFPIWGDEFDATYPYQETTPWAMFSNGAQLPRQYFEALPSYARTPTLEFPQWKVRFIQQNRAWLVSIRDRLPEGWVRALHTFPPSLRKLEWNCQGESRDLWRHILQFRPSGLRVKRYTRSPSLVAMTSTQIPILGREQRHLTRVEGLRLQGFPDDFQLPLSRTLTFKALGNAVHVGLVHEIAKRFLRREVSSESNGDSRTRSTGRHPP